MRGEDWFLPRDGGLSFGGGGRGPARPCGGAGPWLARRGRIFNLCLKFTNFATRIILKREQAVK